MATPIKSLADITAEYLQTASDMKNGMLGIPVQSASGTSLKFKGVMIKGVPLIQCGVNRILHIPFVVSSTETTIECCEEVLSLYEIELKDYNKSIVVQEFSYATLEELLKIEADEVSTRDIDLGEELEKIRKDIEAIIKKCSSVPPDKYIGCIVSNIQRKLKKNICGGSSCGDYDLVCRVCHGVIDAGAEFIKIWVCEQYRICKA